MTPTTSLENGKVWSPPRRDPHYLFTEKMKIPVTFFLFFPKNFKKRERKVWTSHRRVTGKIGSFIFWRASCRNECNHERVADDIAPREWASRKSINQHFYAPLCSDSVLTRSGMTKTMVNDTLRAFSVGRYAVTSRKMYLKSTYSICSIFHPFVVRPEAFSSEKRKTVSERQLKLRILTE